jgi:quercetin dioxygenase-like cupin family protein
MTKNPYLQDTLEDKSVIFGPKQGEVLRFKGGMITFKVTSSISNEQLGVYEIFLEPGIVGAQLHYHRYMDETFIVNEGTLTVSHGKTQTEAERGSVIYVPRFTPHGFANNSDKPVTLTLIFNPGQKREGFFYGLVRILSEEPINAEEFLTLYNKYDSFPVDEKRMLPRKN